MRLQLSRGSSEDWGIAKELSRIVYPEKIFTYSVEDLLFGSGNFSEISFHPFWAEVRWRLQSGPNSII